MRSLSRFALLAGAALLLPAAPAAADPQGRSTLDETVQVEGGYGRGPYHPLQRGAGEPYVTRTTLAPASRRRTRTRRSLAFFGQLTDPQIADTMSPARVELLDPAGGAVSASWRPQETLGPHVFDATIRNLNRNRTSGVRQGDGRRARLGFAITTGDLPDNSQRNETQWMVRVLDGGRVDPFSGKPITAANTCAGATPEQIAKLNGDVAARRYTGVQDYDDYPASAPAERRTGFWDPDTAPGGGVYASFPRYPGLLERALRPFDAEGLKVPWYSSRGNHDGLVQGNAPASSVLFRTIATSCLKIFPSAKFDPASLVGRSADEVFAQIGSPLFAASLLAGAGQTPPDPDRAFVSKPEYKRLQGTADRQHGFGLTERAELRASRGTALYYSFAPRRGLRMIALDTVAEGGGASGNVDDPQYRWLVKTLRAAARRDELVIVYSHHTLETMTNRTPDEAAGCSDPTEAGCDGDPRRSTPLHLGMGGKQSIRDLLLSDPHVIAYVNGHTHHNAVRAFKRGRHGFWQVNTAAHIDFPQQSRELELMDNRDGTLSLFGTILDTAAPIAAPAPGTPADGFSDVQLGALARTLAANDPQTREVTGGGGPGKRSDRNVELLVRDPR
ncbi:metallophosphoesterase [Conexibacter sp. JD483]|uniref:metallophosphoesterase n=1 Tax=unclassified Conexibacter TaxID=2627773 RepID=UPI0027231A84|nr:MULTISPECIES: metallophosphoesterase [unclassified Conexibacter]MDO8187248.1 metallophosphoesterase [Conexibacter sp. CPCC 205706]MDO8199345.1 metallophosphoesterase [Conexibacter sp. CPCC 205762]MDR9372973.1 metallophosphoesterase [Conexibacter sp. JD483]